MVILQVKHIWKPFFRRGLGETRLKKQVPRDLIGEIAP